MNVARRLLKFYQGEKMNLQRRIELLENAAKNHEWPNIFIELFFKDGRKTPDPEPDRLAMVIRAGSPSKAGQTFHRGPDESETDFIARSRYEITSDKPL